MLPLADEQAALIAFFQQGTKMSFKKGEYIVRPGEPPSGVYYIVHGLVKAFGITKYGEENILIIRKAGELAGITWGITGDPGRITYAALTPCELLRVQREDFLQFLNEHPRSAFPLLLTIIDMYQTHTERIMTLGYRSVRERILSFLLSMAKRFGEPVAHGVTIAVPLRHQDIASSISATRETTSRELIALERQGLIVRGPHSIITLCDPKKIQTYL